jgi:thiamine pyrophosphokinase
MIERIVQSSEPVTLIGGGKASPQALHKALTLAPTCVAADGGAALAVAERVALAAVIGDFDSIAPDVLAQIPKSRQHRVPDQSSTDFEKALQRIAAPLVLGIGFAGGRVDHQLAAFHALVAFAHQPCVLLAGRELVFVAPPDIALPCRAGDVVSLFPMGPVTGQSKGLQWPIDGLAFDPGQLIGTSNRALGPVAITMDAPGMLLIVPRRLIQPVVSQLTRPDRARWTVPA